MIGALRIALTYFSVIPLQRWLVGIGAVLFLIGAIVLASGGSGSRDASTVMLVFGGLLTVGLPTLLAGGMMRTASSRRVTHQLPHGRRQMLLGATLAITMLAALATLPPLLLGNLYPFEGARRLPFSGATPLTLFTTSWSVVALLWVIMFVVSGSRILSMLIGFIPLVLIKFGRSLQDMAPDSMSLLAASLAMWAAFGLWYMRVPSIRRLSVYGSSPADASGNKLGSYLQMLLGLTHGALSRGRAMQQLLLGPSLFGHFMIGLGWLLAAALLMLMFGWVMSGMNDQGPVEFLGAFLFLPVIFITWAGLGFALTRRARTLWLRAGLDRTALFRQAERSGALAGAMALGIVMIAYVLVALSSWPQQRDIVLLVCAALAAFCACLFYTGMSLTRGWAAVDAALCSGLLLLFVAALVALPRWIEERSAIALIMPIASALLAPVLRWHARRRWLALDWRVARMLQLPRRA